MNVSGRGNIYLNDRPWDSNGASKGLETPVYMLKVWSFKFDRFLLVNYRLMEDGFMEDISD